MLTKHVTHVRGSSIYKRPNWKKKSPPTIEWINKLKYIHKMESYRAMKVKFHTTAIIIQR